MYANATGEQESLAAMDLADASDLLLLDPRDTQCPRFPRILYRSPLYSTLGIPLPSHSSNAHFSASASCPASPPAASSSLSSSSSSSNETRGDRVTVSVIMTVKDAAPFVEAAVNSLLAQTFVARTSNLPASGRSAEAGEKPPALSALSLSAGTAPASEQKKEGRREDGKARKEGDSKEEKRDRAEDRDAKEERQGEEDEGHNEREEEGDMWRGEAGEVATNRTVDVLSPSDRPHAYPFHDTPSSLRQSCDAYLQSSLPSSSSSPLSSSAPSPSSSSSPLSSPSPSPSSSLTSSSPASASPASATLEDSDGPLEICIFDDASSDATVAVILEKLAPKCLEKGVLLTLAVAPLSTSPSVSPPVFSSSSLSSSSSVSVASSSSVSVASSSAGGGVGYGRNQAVRVCCGEFLCFMDADDESLPERIDAQLREARRRPDTIVGCSFVRDPPDSTPRYTQWLNSLSQSQLVTSRFRECTLLMPTWFMHRDVFLRVGGFVERGQLRFRQFFRSFKAQQNPTADADCRLPPALPEDLLFLYRHLREGGCLCRLERPLYIYKYHDKCTSFAISSDLLWTLRIKEFQTEVMERHPKRPWIIWSVGRDGKRFYRSLSVDNRRRVVAFVDIDAKKVERKFYVDSAEPLKGRKIPVYFWEAAAEFLREENQEKKPIFVICVKYEVQPLNTLQLRLDFLSMQEGRDFFFFC
ncbi:B3GNTL1 protein [Toxoplasma gondii VAND]|uniref:B3GNTL1 protein n=1 Tax=Toxoplasma gondii VAND TaxID=933077 RepID=A0A086Q837_TOXGO|nr:B3GNTL1 protein [Toxoplasma gondii VAND]